MQFQKKVTKNNYVREYVVVLNGLLDLTPREIDVLTAFIKLDQIWTPRNPSEKKNLLSTDSRKIIMKEANMNKSNFQKIANKLLSIGLLVTSSEGDCVVNELMKPIIIKDKIEITFVLDMSNGSIQ